ncbi:hypothetical protein Droror1_Dr00008701 [Drosera rotundifolia]
MLVLLFSSALQNLISSLSVCWAAGEANPRWKWQAFEFQHRCSSSSSDLSILSISGHRDLEIPAIIVPVKRPPGACLRSSPSWILDTSDECMATRQQRVAWGGHRPVILRSRRLGSAYVYYHISNVMWNIHLILFS